MQKYFFNNSSNVIEPTLWFWMVVTTSGEVERDQGLNNFDEISYVVSFYQRLTRAQFYK